MLGFIGAGNMAGAIIEGALRAQVLRPDEIHVYEVNTARAEALRARLGIVIHDSCAQLVAACDAILIAVKPHIVSGVLEQAREALQGKALISIAAGWSSDMLAGALDGSTRFLRVMPNTPALVGAGMTALSRKHTLTPQEATFAEQLFGALGRVAWVEEHQMEAVTGVSGSGPAYAYLFIEAMADGGVACGLPRPLAYEMAAQTLLGASQMVLASESCPGALKDAVCSPGGTTIAAVRVLERAGFRSAAMEAVIAAAEKASSMKQ